MNKWGKYIHVYEYLVTYHFPGLSAATALVEHFAKDHPFELDQKQISQTGNVTFLRNYFQLIIFYIWRNLKRSKANIKLNKILNKSINDSINPKEMKNYELKVKLKRGE